MRVCRLFYALLSVVLVGTAGCSPGGNASVVYRIGGACGNCPAMRIDTSLTAIPGVVRARYNSRTQEVAIRYDSTLTDSTVFIDLLNDLGYDVNDEHYAMAPGLLDACCLTNSSSHDTEAPCFDCATSLDTLELGSVLDDSLLSAEMEAVLEDILLGDQSLNLDEELGLDEAFADEIVEDLEADSPPDNRRFR